MILILVCLILISSSKSLTTSTCSWIGHCVDDPCETYNDCDGSLICINGKCGDGNIEDDTCVSHGYLHGISTECNLQNNSTCCQEGEHYPQYKCSPTSKSSAILTLNSFEEGGDGGGAGACFSKFYSDSERVVALSTGWFNGGSRCGKRITIFANNKSTTAMVVDECDSMNGCDEIHAGQPPCRNNIVDGSPAVWSALNISPNDPRYGWITISWKD